MIGMMPVAPRMITATDFAEIPVGAGLESHGWTRSGINTSGGGFSLGTFVSTVSTQALSGRGIVVGNTSDDYNVCIWDRLGSSVTDFAFLALIRLLDAPDSTGGGGVMRAASGSGYDWVFDADGSPDSVHTSQLTSGFFDTNLGVQDIDHDTTNQFWLRGVADGTTLRIKAWMRGSAEPSFTDATDSTYTTGAVGFQTVQTWQFRVDWFAVALGSGKTAPGPQG